MTAIIIAAVCGIVIGIALGSSENTCPAVELGYDCKGDRCDHRESELYRAKMDMALYREQQAQKDEENSNMWKGGQ